MSSLVLMLVVQCKVYCNKCYFWKLGCGKVSTFFQCPRYSTQHYVVYLGFIAKQVLCSFFRFTLTISIDKRSSELSLLSGIVPSYFSDKFDFFPVKLWHAKFLNHIYLEGGNCFSNIVRRLKKNTHIVIYRMLKKKNDKLASKISSISTTRRYWITSVVLSCCLVLGDKGHICIHFCLVGLLLVALLNMLSPRVKSLASLISE